MKKNLILAAILATLSCVAHASEIERVGLESNTNGNLWAHAAETKLEIPIPGGADFPSYVDLNKFEKACAGLGQWRVTLMKKNDKIISLICETGDGGSVGVTTTEKEAIFTIHQSTQMYGNAISAIDDSFNIMVPLAALNSQNYSAIEKCAGKVKAARDSGNFGDIQIRFNSHIFEATCQDAPAGPSSNPIKNSLRALGSFLTSHAQ